MGQRLGGRAGDLSVGADEAVEHLLAARMLEVDFELVALDGGDGAVAELAVEHALSEAQIVAALVAEADGRCAGFDDALRLAAVIAARSCALPAGAAGLASLGAQRGDVREGVAALAPLRAPQAL